MTTIPPDLRVVCRKLTTAAPADLPALCPVLVGQILRCGSVLAASTEQPGKKQKQQQQQSTPGNEVAVLVHKLRTHVTTLLVHGRTAAARFAGVVLAKAVVDAGGWESLRTAEPWVRGMLAVLQKPDPYASKEVCLGVLVRFYTLLQPYPTLVREMATPTVPAFATACLQLVAKAPTTTTTTAEMAVRALAALVPLYPTTLRPFAAQMRAAVLPYVAPTASDGGQTVPTSLQKSARHLLVLLHYTAAKNGHAEEWTRLVRSLLRQAHATADQVFRAVRESRAAAGVGGGEPVSCDGPPRGGGDYDNDEYNLPAWSGLQSGAERLQGLLRTLAACFACPTKLPVAVPLGAVADLVLRLSMVLPRNEDSSLYNPSIGRDERDELWSMLPAVHGATLALLSGVVRRLGPHVVPLAPDLLDATARLFAATRAVPRARQTAYGLLTLLLPRVGPALARPAVDALGGVVQGCCADLLAAAGYGDTPEKKQEAAETKEGRRKPGSTNADLFLTGPGGATAGTTTTSSSSTKTSTATSSLPPSLIHTAESCLACFLRHVPPQLVKKADRARMDRTAILCGSKPTMVASVLQPYADASGRAFANTIPFLARAFPHDAALEVLRSNLRTTPHFFGDIFAATAPGEDVGGEDEDEDEDEDMEEFADEGRKAEAIPMTLGNGQDTAKSGFALPASVAAPAPPPPPAPRAQPKRHTTTTLPSSLKRKSEEADPVGGGSVASVASQAAKRLDTGKAPGSPLSPKPTADEPVAETADEAPEEPLVVAMEPSMPLKEEADDGDNESDGSVQLEMVFEEGVDDDDEDEDDAMEDA